MDRPPVLLEAESAPGNKYGLIARSAASPRHRVRLILSACGYARHIGHGYPRAWSSLGIHYGTMPTWDLPQGTCAFVADLGHPKKCVQNCRCVRVCVAMNPARGAQPNVSMPGIAAVAASGFWVAPER